LEHALNIFLSFGEIDRVAVCAVELGWVHGWNANFDAALRTTDLVANEMENAAPKLQCQFLLLRAMTLDGRGFPDEGFAALAKAKAIQQPLHDPDLDKEAGRVEAIMMWHVMRLSRSAEIARDVVQLSRKTGDILSEVDMAFIEPVWYCFSGRPREAQHLIEERRPAAERIGHQGVLWAFKQTDIADALCRGDLNAAEILARETIGFGETMAVGWRFLSQSLLGQILFFRGRSDEAFMHLRDAAHAESKTYYAGYASSILTWALANEADAAAEDAIQDWHTRVPRHGRIATYGQWAALMFLTEALALLRRCDAATPPSLFFPSLKISSEPDFKPGAE
jgi:hypothetical protein